MPESGRKWLWDHVFAKALAPAERWLGQGWARAAAVAWLVAIGLVAWRAGGTGAPASPWPWLAAIVGLLIVGTVARYRSGARPAVLLARFTPKGSADKEDVEALEERVSHEMRSRLAAALGSVSVEHTAYTVDVGKESDRRRAIADAADEGYAAVIAANVTVAYGELTVRWAVLPAPRRSRRLRVERSEGSADVEAGQVVALAFTRSTAEAIASLAQITVGLVLLKSGDPREARQVLLGVEPPTYASLYYAALAATRLEDWARAAELAEQAVSIEKRPAGLYLLAWALACVEKRDEAARVFSSVSDPDTLPDVAAVDPDDQLIAQLPPLTGMLLTLGILKDFADGIAESAGETQRQLAEISARWEREDWRMQAARLLHTGDSAEAHKALALHPDWVQADPRAGALFAGALGDLGEVGLAGKWASHAELSLADPGEGTDPWEDLVVAYAKLGDQIATVRCLEHLLPYLDEQDRLVFGETHLREVQEGPELIRVMAAFPLPADPDRLPGHADRLAVLAAAAAKSGELERAADLAARAERVLDDPGTDRLAWCSLIEAYAGCGDVVAVGRCLRRFQPHMGGLERSMLLGVPALQAMAGDDPEIERILADRSRAG